MIPTIAFFLTLAFLVCLGVLMFIVVNVLQEGPPRRAYHDYWRRWRPPIASGPQLMRWGTKVSESVTKKLLSQRRTKTTPTRLALELMTGTTFAMRHVPHLNTETNDDQCPDYSCGRIGITAPEVLAIADQIRSDPAEAKRIREIAITNMRRLAEHVSDESDVPLVCPLRTNEGTCAAYALRPIHCRGICRPAAAVSPQDARILEDLARDLGQGVEMGLSNGLEAAGLDGHVYELNSALAVALDNPDASQRWAQGEDVLASCTRYDSLLHNV